MELSQLFNNHVYKPFVDFYLRFNVTVRYDGFKLKVLSGVFHPGLFFSTKYIYSFINTLKITDRSFLEIGSGTGLLSLLAARNGAKVTAVDVDPKAVKNTTLNFESNFKNGNSATIIQSDLFKELPKQKFDFIVINPPYFFKPVKINEQLAWNCGENGEYFKNLFFGIADYMNNQTEAYMVLADNCDIERIQTIARKNKISFILADRKKIKWETNFIYKLKLDN